MPVHLMSADILANPSDYDGRFAPHVARTSQGFVWLVALGSALGLPLLTAAKLGLSCMLGLYVAAFHWVGRSAGERLPIGALFGVASFASFYLAMGFANFALAVPAALFALGVALRARAQDGWRLWVATGALLLVTAGLHVIVAACAIVQVGALALLERRDGRAAAVSRAVVTALPAAGWGLYVSVTARTADGWGDIAASMGAHRLPIAEQMARWLAGPWGGFTALGGAVAAMALLASLGRSDRRGTFVGATLAFWSLAFAVLPWHAQGWAYAQPRVLIFAWGVPAALGVWGARPMRRLALVTSVLLVYLLAWGDGANRASEQVEAVVSGFDTVNGEAATALTASPGHVPADEQVHPLLHASAYSVLRGAWLTDRYVFNPLIHSASPVMPPPELGPAIPQFAYNALASCATGAACARARAELSDVAAQRARTWPVIVVVGADSAQFESLAARGLRPLDPEQAAPVAGGGTLRLVPASVQMQWSLPDGFAGPLEIRAGYPETIGWLDGRARPAGPNAPTSLRLDGLPAGPIALEVSSDGVVLARAVATLRAGGVTEVTLTAP